MAPDRRLRITQVNTADVGGGAERIAWNLHRAYLARGHHSRLVVGLRRSSAPEVVALPNDAFRSGWARAWARVSAPLEPLAGRVRGFSLLQHVMRDRIGQFDRQLAVELGREDFAYPATWRLLDLLPERPDILHLHNLHGGYFDLRALPFLSQHVPTVVTPHDAWMTTGHCAHSFGCERWRSGCGECPDLTIYPAVRRDATAYNWRRKRAIYARSRLWLATPSRWLLDRFRRSMVAPAIVGARVIPNGVDRSVFRHGDKLGARARLGLPRESTILLFAANGIRRSIWKDYATLRSAIDRLAPHPGVGRVLFLAVGEEGPDEQVGRARIRFVPFQSDPATMAAYYQAADLYLHAARADTFPTTVIEALACGTAVVATAVGGIPEQVRSLAWERHLPDQEPFGQDAATGVLVAPGDAGALSEAVVHLVGDPVRLRQLSQNAAADAARRFDLGRQADSYLSLYEHMLAERQLSADGRGQPLADVPVHGAP